MHLFNITTFGSLLMTVAFFCVGCGPSIEYTAIEPKPEDIVGIYAMTAETVSNLIDVGYSKTDASIILNPDGSFLVDDLPGCWLTHEPFKVWQDNNGPSQRSYDSGCGFWEVYDDNKMQIEKGLTKQHVWKIFLLGHITNSIVGDRGLPKIGKGFNLANRQPPYVLYFVVDDPDEGDALEFNKISDIAKRNRFIALLRRL